MPFVLLALLTLLAACGAESPFTTVRLDASLTPECAVAVEYGVAFWQEQGVPVEISPRGAIVVAFDGALGRPGQTWAYRDGKAPRVWMGHCAGDIGRQTAAHELGHALGIRDHSDDPDNLMFRSTNGQNFALTDGQLELVTP